MSEHRELHRELNMEFEAMIRLLQTGDTKTWTQLVNRLRKVTVPWLAQKVGKMPSQALVSLDEFILEVFANALAKFFPLFEKGTFSKYQDIQSLMFRVAELKLKEGFAQLKREQAIYHPEDEHSFEAIANQPFTSEEEAKKERIQLIQSKLKLLAEEDRKLLERYYDGEKMVKIAKELGIHESSIRKRKQRALDRLKKLVANSIRILFCF